MAQLKKDASLNFNQISTLTAKVTTLDAENKHTKQLLDSANAQVAKLKGNLSMMSTDYGSVCEKKGTLQQQMLLLQEQLSSANASLTHKVASKSLCYHARCSLLLCFNRLPRVSKVVIHLQYVSHALLVLYR